MHRVARVCVRPLLKTSVTPSHLTAARLVSGIAAAGLIASAQARMTIAGCVLFLLAMMLDQADGELARLSGRSTPGGHRFNLRTDAICATLVVLSLGIAQRSGTEFDKPSQERKVVRLQCCFGQRPHKNTGETLIVRDILASHLSIQPNILRSRLFFGWIFTTSTCGMKIFTCSRAARVASS